MAKSRAGEREGHTAEVTERSGDIARVFSPQSSGSSPSLRVRVTVLNVLRYLSPLESPDCNGRVIPKHGEDTTGSHVEGSTSTSFDIEERAASVVTARALALSCEDASEETLVNRAVRASKPGLNAGVRPTDSPGTSMESVLVGVVVVDVFEDVDLQEELESKCWLGAARRKEQLPLRCLAILGYKSKFQINFTHKKHRECKRHTQQLE